MKSLIVREQSIGNSQSYTSYGHEHRISFLWVKQGRANFKERLNFQVRFHLMEVTRIKGAVKENGVFWSNHTN